MKYFLYGNCLKTWWKCVIPDSSRFNKTGYIVCCSPREDAYSVLSGVFCRWGSPAWCKEDVDGSWNDCSLTMEYHWRYCRRRKAMCLMALCCPWIKPMPKVGLLASTYQSQLMSFIVLSHFQLDFLLFVN